MAETETKIDVMGAAGAGDNMRSMVSVIIPCRNEEQFIGGCLDSVLANDYPTNRIEVLVVDGMSDDRTRALVKSYAQTHPWVRLLDNPRKFMPYAVNVGIAAARGPIIVVMGAHARYSPDYVSKCVSYLEEYGADNVGGMMRTEPRANTLVAKGIACVMSHRFGAGTATFRSGATGPKWVDTVFGGCYRKSVFEKIGYFNETLVKTQDREFNQRLRDAGGKILFAPDIQCSYYARGTLDEFVKHLFGGGLWVFYGNRLGGRHFLSLRNFVPLVFVAGMVALVVTSSFLPSTVYLLAAIGLTYLLTAVGFALPVVLREKDPRYIFVLPLLFALAHASYGVGSAVGIIKAMRVDDAKLCPTHR